MLDEILPEAFATVREGARRLVGTKVMVTGHEMPWDMVHYDVQLIGGIQLHLGQDRRNGDGRGQDARRDAAALPQRAARQGRAPRHGELLPRPPRLAVDGAPLQLPRPHGRLPRRHRAGTPERRAAYVCDITYGTNNEFGFDYLRDNMVVSLDQRVQRPHSTRSSTKWTRC